MWLAASNQAFAEGLPLSLRRSERLRAVGLKDVRVERSAERPAFRSGDEMWNWVYYGNPIREAIVGGLTEDQRATKC
jgi:hypothetical protein